MVSSACDILGKDPQRFIVYILADKRLRRDVLDDESLEKVVRQAFKSDQQLANIIQDIDKKKDVLSDCLSDVLASADIQDLIKRNIKNRRTRLRRRVKKDKPTLKGRALTKEINKRLKISIGVSKSRIPKLKQVTIQEATRPVKVEPYLRKGRLVKGKSRTSPRILTIKERIFLENRKNLKPSRVVKEYYDAGLKFRSEESIRKQFLRLRK